MTIKTSSWFDQLPADHVRIGISRGRPRGMAAGYRTFTRLAPGAWFNSVSVEEYDRRYRAEILGPLDAAVVARQLTDIARGGVAVILCYERPNTGKWCHRALVAEWLFNALGIVVPEFGFENVPQAQHPLMHPSLRGRQLTASRGGSGLLL